MKAISGGCLCGAVRYSASSKPIATRQCWCRLCQSLAAGNATINVAFSKVDFVVEGELHDYSCKADSGNVMHRRFCPTCGVHLFSEAEERPNIIVVRVGTLDETESVEIDAIIWTSEAPSWAYLNPDLPQFEHQAPPPQVNVGDSK